MFTVTETYEDEFDAFNASLLQMTPEQIAFRAACEAEDRSREEFESYTLRMIEETLAEMDAEGEMEDFSLYPC